MWFYLRGWLDGEAEAGAWDVFLSGSAEGVFLGMFMAAARRLEDGGADGAAAGVAVLGGGVVNNHQADEGRVFHGQHAHEGNGIAVFIVASGRLYLVGGARLAAHVVSFNAGALGGAVHVRDVEERVPQVSGRFYAHDTADFHGRGGLEVLVIHVNAVHQAGAHAHSIVGDGGVRHGHLQRGDHQGVAEADAGEVDEVAAILALAVGLPRQFDARLGGEAVQVKVFFIGGPARFQGDAEGAGIAGFFQHARQRQGAVEAGLVRHGAGAGHDVGRAVDGGVE